MRLVSVFAVGGANGHGAGLVRSLRQFDREEQKEFHVPIVMRDSGVPPCSGTSTLTIVIGDLNDNPHYSAHKHITVFNYNGLLRSYHLCDVSVLLRSLFVQPLFCNICHFSWS